MECQNCGSEFAPKNEQQKYCDNTCRQEAFYARKAQEKTVVNARITPVKIPVNNQQLQANSIMMTEDTLNRILIERDKAHAQEIARLEAEFKARTLEQRILAIEERIKEAEKEEDKGGTIAGIQIADLVQAYQMYQQMNASK